MSHVQGPTADGSLEVYGTTDTVANWSSLTNDASRILPRMDQLCAKCHRKGGDIDTPVDDEGVGLSF